MGYIVFELSNPKMKKIILLVPKSGFVLGNFDEKPTIMTSLRPPIREKKSTKKLSFAEKRLLRKRKREERRAMQMRLLEIAASLTPGRQLGFRPLDAPPPPCCAKGQSARLEKGLGCLAALGEFWVGRPPGGVSKLKWVGGLFLVWDTVPLSPWVTG